MALERTESSNHAMTSWHQCPLCKQVRMTSDPVSASSERSSRAYLYDDGGYSFPADTGHTEPLHDPAYLIT